MNTDDDAARKARAKRLHKQIDELVEGVPDGAKVPEAENVAVPPARPVQPSPREFIHRRMRELSEEEARGKKDK